MSLIRDILWLIIIFIVVLVILALLRPVWTLKRNPINGVPIDSVDGGKLFGWALLFTIIIWILYFVISRGLGCVYGDKLIL